jgi:UDP-2,3-diacylglucosamine pyrophosphatase LpxH
MHDDVNDINAMSSDGTPCIYVSGDTDKIGLIT